MEYAAARNRQWHAFMVAERPRRGSPTLLRAFVRCALRQLGRPAMLAASAQGDVASSIGSLFDELADALAAALEQLHRTFPAPNAAGGVFLTCVEVDHQCCFASTCADTKTHHSS